MKFTQMTNMKKLNFYKLFTINIEHPSASYRKQRVFSLSSVVRTIINKFYKFFDRHFFILNSLQPFQFSLSLLKLMFITKISIMSAGCALESEKEISERVDTLYMAILLKERECNTRPEFPILRFDKKQIPPKYGTRACTLEILLQPCPFLTYPVVCLEFYRFDVPNQGPDIF